MNTPLTRVRITLQNISLAAFDGYKNPIPVPGLPLYLWTVFFKIDGEIVDGQPRAYVDSTLTLQGQATIFPTSGDHGDLSAIGNLQPVTDVVSIPASLGDFRTVLTPIPIQIPGLNMTADGVVGCAAVLMYQDSTPDDAAAQGHNALNSSLQQQLDNLIPTLSAKQQTPSQAQVQALENQISSAVTAAVKNALSGWDKFLTWIGNKSQDSAMGSVAYYVSAGELASSPPAGISVTNGYPNPTSITIPEFESGSIKVQFNGIITGDPLPLSMKRILTRVGVNRVSAAMAATSGQSGGSVTGWIDAIT
jgi:hypothetical protein